MAELPAHELLLDLARRFCLLVRELAPQLHAQLQPGPPTAQLGQLCRHLSALLRSLGLDTTADAIRLAVEAGY